LSAYKIALWLAFFTIGYNTAEGIIATWFGIQDGSATLFGFGVDSFVEIISGIGIAHMIFRTQRDPGHRRDAFERTALRVTGTAFYILVAGLLGSSVFIIVKDHRPETTLWGIIISLVSIVIMTALIYAKLGVGKKLHSDAIVADAKCTRVCVYMSVILLIASGVYEITHMPYIDAAGTLGLAYFSFTEGKECFEKANNPNPCSC
jgi:divalent metal cation (Fe/Co/Zn/Cd) transporter